MAGIFNPKAVPFLFNPAHGFNLIRLTRKFRKNVMTEANYRTLLQQAEENPSLFQKVTPKFHLTIY